MIRELDRQFTKSGIEYRQLIKNDMFVLYECKKGTDKYYELFKLRIGKPHPLSKETYDAVELYPSVTAFGLWAWCCNNVDSINKILHKHISTELILTKEDLK